VTKTVSGSFNLGLASPEDVAKTIKGNGALNLGFSWSVAKTTWFSYGCDINAHDKASVLAAEYHGVGGYGAEVVYEGVWRGDVV
jgi:hypothetical protein